MPNNKTLTTDGHVRDNKDFVFDILEQEGIAAFEVEFDGSGDSGQVEGISLDKKLLQRKIKGCKVKNGTRWDPTNPVSDSDVNNFITWVKENPQEVELWLAWGKRLHPEVEKILLEKGKDKIGILEYCTKFGIIIPDSSKVTLKAAFSGGRDSWREKRYVKKIEETKKHMKGFLVQMIGLGQIRGDQTIAEVLETL